MNILFLTSTFPRFNNDSQAPFVLEQAQAWQKHRPEDKVFILAPHDPQAKKNEQLDGIQIYRFQYWWPAKLQILAYPAILPNLKKNPISILQLPFFLLSEFFAALKLIKKHKINLLYAHWVMPQGLIAYVTKKINGTPYALQNHSSDLRIFNKLPIFGKFLARKIIKSSQKLFCVNSLLKKEALEFFNNADQTAINDKISVLPMGVNYSSIYNPSPTKHHKYTFGFIGRLSKKKGINFFIQALQKLKQEGASFSSVIAGDGEEKNNLLQLSKNMPVEFTGFVSKEKKKDFFDQTKFIIFPSYATGGDIEGLPVALLEALSLGKIVIATDATNIKLLPEWPHIKDAIFILNNPENIQEFTQLLHKLLDLQNDFIETQSNNLKEIVKKYQWDNLIKEYNVFFTKKIS